MPNLHGTNLMSLEHVALPACAVQALKTAHRGHKTEYTHDVGNKSFTRQQKIVAYLLQLLFGKVASKNG